MKKSLISILLLALLFSCGSQEQQQARVDVQPQEPKTATYVNSYKSEIIRMDKIEDGTYLGTTFKYKNGEIMIDHIDTYLDTFNSMDNPVYSNGKMNYLKKDFGLMGRKEFYLDYDFVEVTNNIKTSDLYDAFFAVISREAKLENKDTVDGVFNKYYDYVIENFNLSEEITRDECLIHLKGMKGGFLNI